MGTETNVPQSQTSPRWTNSSIPAATGTETGSIPAGSGVSDTTCDEEYTSFPGNSNGAPGTEASVTGRPTGPGNGAVDTTCTEITTTYSSCSESEIPQAPVSSAANGNITMSTPPFQNVSSIENSKPSSPFHNISPLRTRIDRLTKIDASGRLTTFATSTRPASADTSASDARVAGESASGEADSIPTNANFPFGMDSPVHRHQDVSAMGVGVPPDHMPVAPRKKRWWERV